MEVREGEVHGVIGENGAGKSTLMNTIFGSLQRDEGTIRFMGEEVQFKCPADALAAGISMIHQELNPEPYLTIAESIFLNREDVKKGIHFLDKKKTNERAEKILREFDFPKGARTMMEDLMAFPFSSGIRMSLIVFASTVSVCSLRTQEQPIDSNIPIIQ